MKITNEHLDISKRISELLCYQFDDDSLYRSKRLRNINYNYDQFDDPNDLKEFYKAYNLLDKIKYNIILKTLDTKESTELLNFLKN